MSDNPHDDELIAMVHIGRQIIVHVVIRYSHERQAYVLLLNDDVSQEIDADPDPMVLQRLGDRYLQGFIQGYILADPDTEQETPGVPPHIHKATSRDMPGSGLDLNDLRN